MTTIIRLTPFNFLLLVFALFLSGCVSTGGPLEVDVIERVDAAALPVAPAFAGLAVRNIPQKFMDGLIFVTGNKGQEGFSYSPKTFQRIQGREAEIKLYSKTGMIQEPFIGSGVFTVVISLYQYPEASEKTAETRIFSISFFEGAASVNWLDGSLQ